LIEMAEKDTFEVVVKEAARDDAGRGIARLSIEVMRALSLVSGDVIEIAGKKRATAIVWPGFAQDTGQSILRIDGTVRANAGTGVDERARIRKVEVGVAKKVVIQPTQPIRLVGGEQYLARVLRGRPVMEGQAVRVYNFTGKSCIWIFIAFHIFFIKMLLHKLFIKIKGFFVIIIWFVLLVAVRDTMVVQLSLIQSQNLGFDDWIESPSSNPLKQGTQTCVIKFING